MTKIRNIFKSKPKSDEKPSKSKPTFDDFRVKSKPTNSKTSIKSKATGKEKDLHSTHVKYVVIFIFIYELLSMLKSKFSNERMCTRKKDVERLSCGFEVNKKK